MSGKDIIAVPKVNPTQKDVVPSSLQCPMLSSTNYTVWAMRMKVTLRIHSVWEAIDPGLTDDKKNDIAIGLLFQSIPESLILQVGDLDSPKKIWESIKTRHLGADRVKVARLQTLVSDFDKLRMRDTDSVDSFAARISEFATKSASLGQILEESKLVKKLLDCVPRNRFIQLVATLEQVLDLEKTTFEEIVGRLKAYEERIRDEGGSGDSQSRLLFSKSDRRSNRYDNESSGSRDRGRGQFTRGRNRGRGRFNPNDRKSGNSDRSFNTDKRDRSRVTCFRCSKLGHYSSECPERNQRTQEANKIETEEADRALYLHEIVFLNEENVMPKKFKASDSEEGLWYLDNGASNHMTRKRS